MTEQMSQSTGNFPEKVKITAGEHEPSPSSHDTSV